jgi:alcohol dehydrogenase (cytochrome c)
VSALHSSFRAVARPSVRGLIVLSMLGVAAWLGLSVGKPRASANEPRAAQQQPAAGPVGPVDDDDLLRAGSNQSNWLLYGRTYDGHRFSPLKQINTENVSKLIPVWTFQTGVLDGFECTPLVIDGIMYVTTPWNHAYAIDAKSGDQIWHYQKSLPENLALCCDAVGRATLHVDPRRPPRLPRS